MLLFTVDINSDKNWIHVNQVILKLDLKLRNLKIILR